MIPLVCSRTNVGEQAHKHCSSMASWDQQELPPQQCWLKTEALESLWEEAEERGEKKKPGYKFDHERTRGAYLMLLSEIHFKLIMPVIG